MNKNQKLVVVCLFVAVIAVVAWLVWSKVGAREESLFSGMGKEAPEIEFEKAPPTEKMPMDYNIDFEDKKSKKPKAADDEDATQKPSAEEQADAAKEAKVDAFDALTDKWMEPSEKGVTMDDINAFARVFREVPQERKDECIHRALNLIPDENVMLLAGILMDKSADKEIVETVFNDVLNRDEDVKQPILRQIYKDKTHPCWDDVAWIMDVTGETTAKN